MQTYMKRIAGALNAVLLVSVLVLVVSEGGPVTGVQLLFLILLIVTPAFTIFALFAPSGR